MAAEREGTPSGGDETSGPGSDMSSESSEARGPSIARPEEPADAAAEIDVRFSFANERTFLAWNRTALAMITAGLAITQLLPPFELPGGRKLIGLPLILFGAILAVASLRQWSVNEDAMRRGVELPSPFLTRLTAVIVGIVAAVALVLVAFGSGS